MIVIFLLCVLSTLAIAFSASFMSLVIFLSYLGITNIEKAVLKRYGAMSKFLLVDKQIIRYTQIGHIYDEVDADDYQMQDLTYFLEVRGVDGFHDSPQYALSLYSYIAKASSKTDLISRVGICVKWLNNNLDDHIRSEIKLILRSMLLDWKKTMGFFKIINSFSSSNLHNRSMMILKGLIFAVLLPADKLLIFFGSTLVKFILTDFIIEALVLIKTAMKRNFYSKLSMRNETYKEVERLLSLECNYA